jgi:LPXTG-motif cell wall-anchored protein
MRWRRVRTATAIAVVATLAPVLLLSSPSHAEAQRLQVGTSANGPWSDRLAAALFDDVGPLVPRDVVTRTFYLRNGSRQAARPTLALADRSADDELAQHLTVTAAVGAVSSDVEPAGGPGSGCTALVTGAGIPAGGVQEVAVTLRLDDMAGQVAMNQRTDLDLVVTLSEVGPTGRVDVCGAEDARPDPAGCPGGARSVVTVLGAAGCPDVKGAQAVHATGTLADTGAPRGAGTLAGVGLGLVGGGVLLLAVRRRRERA